MLNLALGLLLLLLKLANLFWWKIGSVLGCNEHKHVTTTTAE